MRRAVTILGIGDDGCVGLSSRAMNAVAKAHVLVGGERHLAFFPQFEGERVMLKSALKGGLSAALDRVEALAGEHNVCVLASGDPMFFGVGALIVKRFGAEHVEIVPQPSSVQWAFARAGLSWDDAAFVSVHGRSQAGFVSKVRSHAKICVLTDEESSPPRLARALLDHGDADLRAWVCEDLGGPGERVRAFSLAELADERDVRPLNVALFVRPSSWRPAPVIPFLPEEEFAKRMPKCGLITKREVRLLSLAQLGIRRDSVIWDIGAGSGSVAIEAAMLAPLGRTYAIEVDEESVGHCRENARHMGADNVRVIHGRAPEALAPLETPDAVFVGGSKGSMDAIIDVALARLAPRGRLVINAVTLENVAETYQVLRVRGLHPDVTLVQISRGAPLARYTRYEAQNPIHIFAVEKAS